MGRIITVCRAVGVALFLSVVFAGAGTTSLAAQPPEPLNGFVPMNDIPPEEQLPAAPLLVAAYAAVWAITIGYLWTIWRRLGTLEQELADVSRRVAEREQSW